MSANIACGDFIGLTETKVRLQKLEHQLAGLVRFEEADGGSAICLCHIRDLMARCLALLIYSKALLMLQKTNNANTRTDR